MVGFYSTPNLKETNMLNRRGYLPLSQHPNHLRAVPVWLERKENGVSNNKVTCWDFSPISWIR
jgi:hypothetical protein